MKCIKMSWIFVVLITAIYLSIVCIYVFDMSAFLQLELNAKGDALAGIFAPLAFFWLVFGYFQQGKELKQNTAALRLQAKELGISNESLTQQVKEMQNSVAVQENMFRLADRQYTELLNQKKWFNTPNLKISPYNFENNSFSVNIFNLNISLNNISIENTFFSIHELPGASLLSCDTDKNIEKSKKHFIKKLETRGEISLKFYKHGSLDDTFSAEELIIHYRDANGRDYKDTYLIELENNKVKIEKT